MMMLLPGVDLSIDGVRGTIEMVNGLNVVVRMPGDVLFAVSLDDIMFETGGRYRLHDEEPVARWRASRADWAEVEGPIRTRYRLARAQFDWMHTGIVPDQIPEADRRD